MTSRSPRRSARLVAAVALTLAVGAIGAFPEAALAADDHLQVSTDGVTFVSSHTLPLYPDTWRFVPGDSESRSVWVRNGGDAAGRLRIELLPSGATDLEFAKHVEVSATPAGDAAAEVTMSDALANGACTVLSGGRVLAPGEQLRIDVSARVAPTLAGQQGVQQAVDFAVHATLFGVIGDAGPAIGSACVGVAGDAVAAPGTATSGTVTSGTAARGSALAHTGGTLYTVPIVIGAAGIAAGIFVVLAARRRARQEEDGHGIH
ncbi:MAG: hypothetical protein DI566_06915 [Microbacterium sp.]|nr:MAG: hypothetical protein DI566_06915 [Microbacterium sp.]